MNETSIKNKKPLYRSLIIIAVIIIIITTFWLNGWYKYLTIDYITENRNSLQSFVNQNFILALFIFTIIYIIATALSFPGAIMLTLIGGFLFGWIIGWIAVVFAATIGATAIFIAAQTSIGDIFTRKVKGKLSKITKGFKENQFNYLLFLRLVPIFPFWLVNIAPALLNVPLRIYTIATLIGIIPGSFVLVFFGASLDDIIIDLQKEYQQCMNTGKINCQLQFDPSSIITPQIITALIGLGILSIIPIIIKKLRTGKTNEPT